MIGKIKIEPNKHKPEVILDPTANTINFSGVSLPEDAMEFFFPILNWLNDYYSICDEKIKDNVTLKASFKLFYYNTASHRAFLEIFRVLKRMKEKGLKIHVDWYYEKDDINMYENGTELAEMAELDPNYIETE